MANRILKRGFAAGDWPESGRGYDMMSMAAPTQLREDDRMGQEFASALGLDRSRQVSR